MTNSLLMMKESLQWKNASEAVFGTPFRMMETPMGQVDRSQWKTQVARPGSQRHTSRATGSDRLRPVFYSRRGNFRSKHIDSSRISCSVLRRKRHIGISGTSIPFADTRAPVGRWATQITTSLTLAHQKISPA
ncbi:hypothetical protein AVEN_208857-1 [Araneus ventricosus]|uniref:Uncharacterized protein n=1 Tax=Araneus ventricosus TaxID=182803 RepID=A0A4Y2KLZ1_ARAVE|nr:hypothetical protein AVEN_208857-1 [Araneus ventricosus]